MRYLINSGILILQLGTPSVPVSQNLHIKQFNVALKFIFCMILHDIVNFIESYIKDTVRNSRNYLKVDVIYFSLIYGKK